MPKKVQELNDSILPPPLIDAYKKTNFDVLATPSFTLNVASYSADLKLLHERHRVESSCFITAYNPYSEELKPDQNSAAQHKLMETLLGLGFKVLEGLGSDPTGEWEGEPSFFVLGISILQSKALGNEFKQNAIVWCDKRCIPELLLLR
jgi:hypothetical protein